LRHLLILFLALMLAGCSGTEGSTATGGPAPVLGPAGGTVEVVFAKSSVAARTAGPGPIDAKTATFEVSAYDQEGNLVGSQSAANDGQSTQKVVVTSVPNGQHEVVAVFRGSDGKALGAEQSTAVVSDTLGGSATFSTVNVPSSLAVSPGALTLLAGRSGRFQARVTFTNGRTANVTSSVSWSSSQTSVATVDAQGLVRSIASGSCTVTASFDDDLTATGAVTVDPTSIAVPTHDFDKGKTLVHASIGGGPSTKTELDTGSGALVVEQSKVGPNVVVTGIPVTITYAHGTNNRSGVLAFGTFELLDGDGGQPLLGTTGSIPLLVVPDGVVSNNGENKAIFGLRMNSSVSPKIFFPVPYNQMVLLNRPAHTIAFGRFSLEGFGMVSLPVIAGDDSGLVGGPLNLASYWNDAAIPVKYVISPGTVAQTWDSLVDTGASSSFQASPPPPNLQFTPVVTAGGVIGGVLQNQVLASLPTSLGPMPIYLTDTVDVYETNFNGTIVNVGNNMANFYQILLDQASGRWGIAPIQQ
jgi:hypothetical protein